ncbi:adhesion G-protein coupled receptor G2-like [Cololabis saira]|uniref:adhesion G-protein coupled receptor G2-like n=1 Tax=Cololabis saira TaxID=129043 RepID=UPI002AD3A2C2|nr:adhesion G-protein coupled receptor G2-like [Cololabis saira]
MRCPFLFPSVERLIKNIERYLEGTLAPNSMSIGVGSVVTYFHKATSPFRGLKISASETEAETDGEPPNLIVSVQLPGELDVGLLEHVIFCMIHLPNRSNISGSSELVNERLIGLTVPKKNISGLQERVNITIHNPGNIDITHKPQCVFLDYPTKKYRSDGCLTLWERGQNNVTCSCDHLTYFGVLMVSAKLSATDQQVLSYITRIGCGVSLLALVIVVLLFITNKNARADDAKKIHVSLAVALILLNVHFLPSQAVAEMSLPGLCLYVAVGLHYSLLATFSWMALEAFHLYLLLIKVFNIYVSRYLLKLSVIGWGVPALIVSIVPIVDKEAYGHVPLDSSHPNSTAICYIANNVVKNVTTVGVFGLVFLFNVTICGVTVKWVLMSRHNTEFGQSLCERARRDICTLLTIFTLLGITWGLIFLSYGHLTTPLLYIFCILNSLQGFFFFLYFVLSLKKPKDSPSQLTNTTGRSNQ